VPIKTVPVAELPATPAPQINYIAAYYCILGTALLMPGEAGATASPAAPPTADVATMLAASDQCVQRLMAVKIPVCTWYRCVTACQTQQQGQRGQQA